VLKEEVSAQDRTKRATVSSHPCPLGALQLQQENQFAEHLRDLGDLIRQFAEAAASVCLGPVSQSPDDPGDGLRQIDPLDPGLPQ